MVFEQKITKSNGPRSPSCCVAWANSLILARSFSADRYLLPIPQTFTGAVDTELLLQWDDDDQHARTIMWLHCMVPSSPPGVTCGFGANLSATNDIRVENMSGNQSSFFGVDDSILTAVTIRTRRNQKLIATNHCHEYPFLCPTISTFFVPLVQLCAFSLNAMQVPLRATSLARLPACTVRVPFHREQALWLVGGASLL